MTRIAVDAMGGDRGPAEIVARKRWIAQSQRAGRARKLVGDISTSGMAWYMVPIQAPISPMSW